MNFKWWVALHWHHHLERESRKDKICHEDLILMQPHCTKRPLLSMIYQNLLNETRKHSQYSSCIISMYIRNNIIKICNLRRLNPMEIICTIKSTPNIVQTLLPKNTKLPKKSYDKIVKVMQMQIWNWNSIHLKSTNPKNLITILTTVRQFQTHRVGGGSSSVLKESNRSYMFNKGLDFILMTTIPIIRPMVRTGLMISITDIIQTEHLQKGKS